MDKSFVESLPMKKILRDELKINKENTESYRQKFKSTMPIVMCACGAKILVVPDLAAMDRAIKNHKAKHKSADEQFLTEQILEVASKQALRYA